jgi:hypothetical protein
MLVLGGHKARKRERERDCQEANGQHNDMKIISLKKLTEVQDKRQYWVRPANNNANNISWK